MYEIKLINPLRQYETVYWTLTFLDTEGFLPSIRVDKKYSEEASPETICADVSRTLTDFVFELTRSPFEYDEEGNPLPQGDGLTVNFSGETLLVDDVGGVHYQWQI